ncbi:hypothetical protein [Acinetobacter sp. V115_6]|uniref:hypothetical protein n=1 Tax=Acinetobacter sp. V115_6 TaxID=3072987 RepID=UPI00287D7597|nr:hypothetical protein [Acinetobacter sp. V115_6]MDS7927574.1 hypothetical protein [Acinetobacter sp. V115_6]
MTSEIITRQELEDAKADARSLEKFISGTEIEDVLTRLGMQYPTLAKLIRILMETGGWKAYATEAALLATVPTVNPSVGYAFDTKKMYLWNGTNWINEGLSQLDQAKDFTVKANSIDSRFQFRDFNFYSGAVTIPLYMDSNFNVLFGLNTVTDELYGNGLIDNKRLSSMHVFTGVGKYPLVIDSVGNTILGYDAILDQLFGVFPGSTSGSSSQPDVPLPFTMSVKAVNYILAYGQSLSTGVGQNVAVSTSQPFFNTTFASGVRGNGGDFSGLKPLVEDTAKPTPDGEIRSGETICSGAANYASLSAYKENGIKPQDHVIFASTAGHGNYTIQQLSKGSEWYNTQFINHVTGAKNLNPDLALHVINWAQGEASVDSTQPVHYAALIQFQADAEADIKAITGQTSPVLMFTYQHSTFIYKKPAVALALLQACQTSEKFYFIAPTYAFPPAVDNIHLSEVGYKWLGAYYGRAYKQAIHDKIKPRAIMPKGATISGNTITVKLNVPHKPLVFDTINLASTRQGGFAVFDGSNEIMLTDWYVQNGDEVVLELATTPTGTVTVNYAIDYLASSLQLFKGASGNLRDSCTDTCQVEGETKPMFYICPHFSLTAISENI